MSKGYQAQNDDGTITNPGISGGTTTTSSLTLKPTTGAGVAGADIIMQTGNNGGTEAMRIRGASASTAVTATGGTITTSGSYTIHTFTTSGTFTPSGPLSVDCLVVAGGGGGGNSDSNYNGAGGGAGGLVTGSFGVIGQAYSVVVGAGGAAITNGSNSSFATLTAIGGGYGGGAAGGATLNGQYGGSGGGGSNVGTIGIGTTSQGNNGGAGLSGTFTGGGGGASATGGDSGSNSGNGGAGTANSYSGASVTYAGGGGGGKTGGLNGTGGAGGGGNGGSSNTNGSNGTANTGGGGGGGGASTGLGGQGGSGIVIIRYLTSSVFTTPVGVGLETPAPSAIVHLPAGTATAYTAPLKFTSGTNLSSAEPGAAEYDGTNLYFTTSSAARQSISLDSSTVLIASPTITVAWANTKMYTLTPKQSATLNATGGVAGKSYVIIITTSGTTSYTLTFGTNFKTTGTLATGTSSGKVFAITFAYDGTNFNETGRTTAM